MAHGGFESTLLAESTVARQLDEMQKIATDYRTLEEKLRHVEELNAATAREAAAYRDRAVTAEAKLAEHANSKARQNRRNDLLKTELKRTAAMLTEKQQRMEGDSEAMARENSELRMCVTDLELRVADSDASFEKQRELAQKLEERCIASETKQWQLEKKLEERATMAKELAQAKEESASAKSRADTLRQQTEEAVAAQELAHHTQAHLQRELESSRGELARVKEELHNTHTQLLESHVAIEAQKEQLAGYGKLKPIVAALETKFTQQLRSLEEEAQKAGGLQGAAEERAREAERRQILAEATAERDRCKLTHQLQSARLRSDHAAVALQKEQSAAAALRSEIERLTEGARRDCELQLARAKEETDALLGKGQAERSALQSEVHSTRRSLEDAQSEVTAARTEAKRYKAEADEHRIKLQEQSRRLEQDRHTLSGQTEDLRRLLASTQKEASSSRDAAQELQSQLQAARRKAADLEQQLADVEAARAEERERRAQAAKTRRNLMEDRVRLERALYREISRPSESGSPQPLGTTHLQTRGAFESTGGSASGTGGPDATPAAFPREASSSPNPNPNPNPAAAGSLSATRAVGANSEQQLTDAAARGMEEHAHAD